MQPDEPPAQPPSTRPLRVLQVMRAPVGGLFRHVADLTRELAGEGHAVGLVVDSLASDAQTETRLLALAPFAGLGITRLPMPRLAGFGDLTTALAVRRLARDLAIDVVHGHGAKGGFHARLAGAGRAATFYTPHGGVLHYLPGTFAGRLFHGLERRLARLTDAIVFESDFARKAYEATIGVPPCATAVIHNGINRDEFEPVCVAPDAADFVFIGELRDLKGVHVLVDAMAGLAHPDGAPARLVMAGAGDARPALERRIAERGLAGAIALVGAQPARAVFARGRVVIVPSLAESLPYIVLEAAAAGRPLIATRVGGIPEIFGPEAGRLVPPGDRAALAAAMQAALAAPEALDAPAARLRAIVRDKFCVGAMGRAIVALYRQCLARHEAARPSR